MLSIKVLVLREANMDQFKKNLFFGDTPTVVLLLPNQMRNFLLGILQLVTFTLGSFSFFLFYDSHICARLTHM